jgi:uncharacterized membrane protein
MSMIFIIPFGFFLLHSPIFDSFLGGTYGVSSFLALAFRGVAGLESCVVMSILFYCLRAHRYNFFGFSQKNLSLHTAHFITARMSMIFIIPFGFFLLHSPIFDSFLGGTYGVSSFLALAFRGVAGLESFVVMSILFYYLRTQRYNFFGFSQKNLSLHAAYFITARMSMIFIIPFGFFLLHSPIFDSFLGGMYGVSSFLALAFRGVAGLESFVVMLILFYCLRTQRYNFFGSHNK